MSQMISMAPQKGFLGWLSNALLRPQPGPGIQEGRILTSEVITSRTRQGVVKRALALTWVNALGDITWYLPQVIPLGQAGTSQRDRAIEMVRAILWAGGYKAADPLVITAENLKGLRVGLVLVEAPHWHTSDRKIIQVSRFMCHL